MNATDEQVEFGVPFPFASVCLCACVGGGWGVSDWSSSGVSRDHIQHNLKSSG